MIQRVLVTAVFILCLFDSLKGQSVLSQEIFPKFLKEFLKKENKDSKSIIELIDNYEQDSNIIEFGERYLGDKVRLWVKIDLNTMVPDKHQYPFSKDYPNVRWEEQQTYYKEISVSSENGDERFLWEPIDLGFNCFTCGIIEPIEPFITIAPCSSSTFIRLEIENNRVISAVQYFENDMDGNFFIFDYNGHLRLSGTFENNLLHGETILYNENGKIAERYLFENARLTGFKGFRKLKKFLRNYEGEEELMTKYMGRTLKGYDNLFAVYIKARQKYFALVYPVTK